MYANELINLIGPNFTQLAFTMSFLPQTATPSTLYTLIVANIENLILENNNTCANSHT